MSKPTIAIHSGKAPYLEPLLRVMRTEVHVARMPRRPQDLITPGVVHMIWGMPHTPARQRELAKSANTFFLEQGWFPQKKSCQLDAKGLHGYSSIRGAVHQNSPAKKQQVGDYIKQLHQDNGVTSANTTTKGIEEYILVSLQVENDAQMRYWTGSTQSGCKQLWLVDAACKAFPNERIVVRPHPLDRKIGAWVQSNSKEVQRHKHIQFISDGGIYPWLSNAKAVVGINSTVLLEALTFFKPVCALGLGLFCDNGVVFECGGNSDRMSGFAKYIPDEEQIWRFMTLLIMDRQIPYSLTPSDIGKYSVLVQAIQRAKEL